MGGTFIVEGVTISTEVAVLGGGLSGISAALWLSERGYRVKLVEKRPFLGGRACSFFDRKIGCEVDNGQHIFLGCYDAYLRFLDDLSATRDVFLQEQLRIEVMLDGRKGVIYGNSKLGPFHLFPSLISYSHLNLSDKLRVIYGMLKARYVNCRKSATVLDSESFYHWLKRHHQSNTAIANLWNLVIVSALNDDVKHVSSLMALTAIQTGFLSDPKNAVIGYPKVGLTSLLGDTVSENIAKTGGELVLGTTVRSVYRDNSDVLTIGLSGDRKLIADAYICAVPHDVLLNILEEDITLSHPFHELKNISYSPILGIHLWYDRKILDQDFVAFLDSPVQWVFNKSLIHGLDYVNGQYLTISVSSAWDYMDTPKHELRKLFCDEMQRLLPRAREAKLRKVLVVKQRQATFRSLPGTVRLRPSQKTSIPNLFIAGEWTDTGWPSTMEGAVRSGVLAAQALRDKGI